MRRRPGGPSSRPGRRESRAAGNGRPGGARREVSLQDKYVLDEGRILLTGVQGLVRVVLDQHRAEGVPLKAVAFTNFSRDHLDYHPSMEAYFEAKMRLFDELLPADGAAVIWTDDPKSDEVVRRCEARGLRRLTVGRRGETLKLVEREPTQLGQRLVVEAQGKAHKVELPLIGATAYTALAALAANLIVATLVTLVLGPRGRADDRDETRAEEYDELEETHEPAPTVSAGVA